MVRKFSLLNEKGQEYSLMDINNYCLLTDPSGLGYSYNSEYEQLGNTFINTIRTIGQGSISGTLNFLNYDNYRKLIKFMQSSQKLQLEYVVPYVGGEKTFYRDVELNSISKSQIQPNGIISESISLTTLSLWYEKVNTIYTIEDNDNVVRWDFDFDSYWNGYDVRNLEYTNLGDVEAPIEVIVNGEVINPKLELYIEGELYQTITISDTIEEYEQLIYNSKENEFAIKKRLADGTYESLFSLDYINFSNDNVLRIPNDRTCTIKLRADETITNATLIVYVYYVAV